MRNIDTLEKKLTSKGLDFGYVSFKSFSTSTHSTLHHSLPTIFIAECVLVYMEPHLSQNIIKWAGSHFSTALFLNYEPVSTCDWCNLIGHMLLSL